MPEVVIFHFFLVFSFVFGSEESCLSQVAAKNAHQRLIRTNGVLEQLSERRRTAVTSETRHVRAAGSARSKTFHRLRIRTIGASYDVISILLHRFTSNT
ncbi:hypothetical protein Y032_0147g2592 [Ancylostoma ceylanicum]|uniref:Secreted protein n=1 Tax=Ancylostoma ceylanicum TaxID=53326 RepID=A0A016T244_9BILA|nr:hypothetical protein Y032_0147g2592 [Ancylostoma ceylanicum]